MSTVALVTGSSSGLGMAIVKQLIGKVDTVVLTGRSAEALKKLVTELPGTLRSRVVAGDLTETRTQEQLVALLHEEHLLPDIVIHNMGGRVLGDDPPLSVEALRRSMQLNVEVAVSLNAALLPAMVKRQKGRIIHISSDASLTGQSAPGYAAAKAALNAYVKSTARYYAPHNIMLCAVLPGVFEHEGSAWFQKKITHPEYYQERVQQMPLKRFGRVDEIAEVVVDLACGDSMMSAGSLIELTGAWM